MTEMKNAIEGIMKEMDVISQREKDTDTKIEVLIESKLVEPVDNKVVAEVKDRIKVVKEDVDGKLEIERRKYNLIFHGVKKGEDR